VLIERLPVDIRRGLTLSDLADDPSARASDTLGRLHLAKALIRRGGVATISDVFAHYLGDEHTSDDVLEAFPTVAVTAALIRSSGGIAILAHPGIYKHLSMIKELVGCGLDGLEVNHPNLDPSLHAEMLTFAREQHLLISAGSDLHFLGRRRPGEWSMGDAHQALLERLVAA
jgi:predicted metal-dependent phosphoesterase TrpH